MRTAPKGKYFIKVINNDSGKSFHPLYDGFDTKKEIRAVIKSFEDRAVPDDIKGRYTYLIVDKNDKEV